MNLVLAAQGFALLYFFVKTCIIAAIYLPYAIFKSLLPSNTKDEEPGREGDASCVFYEGSVYHVRRIPIYNAFRYPVRMAVVDLDEPPSWWHEQASDHMTADEARSFAETKGGVLLLTTPVSAGYSQNPISVYYCKAAGGELRCCIAEVTNTPWGERVTFLFDPEGQEVPKAMHVSPLMDMKSTWRIRAPLPGERCELEVLAVHPEMGAFFNARLTARRSRSHSRSEFAGLPILWRYGFMPHRVAFWIYWQAARLLWMGVPFFGYPPPEIRAEAEKKATNPVNSQNSHFVWRAPLRYPWNAM